MRTLEKAPAGVVGPDGAPLFGAYQGVIGTTDLRPVAKRLGLAAPARLFREKRWIWFGAGDERMAVGAAIVDLGYVGSTFLWILDRATGRLLVDGSAILPAFAVRVGDVPGDGLQASARPWRGGLSMVRQRGGMLVNGRLFGASLSLRLASGPGCGALSAICPVAGHPGAVNVTQKNAPLQVSGEVVAAGHRFRLDGAAGFTDYTHGLLARDTAWRWAAAFGALPDGRPVGLNLTEGFNDGVENVVFLGGEPRGVGAARFQWDKARPEAPWSVTTDDGAVDLRLAVEGVRREDVDLKLAVSRYAQPIGTWSGTLAGERVDGLLGVAEDHVARW